MDSRNAPRALHARRPLRRRTGDPSVWTVVYPSRLRDRVAIRPSKFPIGLDRLAHHNCAADFRSDGSSDRVSSLELPDNRRSLDVSPARNCDIRGPDRSIPARTS